MTSVLIAFIVHEARTQARSLRFRTLGITFVALSSTPAIILPVLAANSTLTLGAGSLAGAVFMLELPLAALIAFFCSFDGIAREHEEGSLPVVALAPLSNVGYVLRRWFAIVCTLVPLTAVPPAVAVVVAVRSQAVGMTASLFVSPWLLRVVPLVVLITALALALGTIAGDSGVALAACVVLGIVGSSFANDVLALFHYHLDLPIDLLGFADAFAGWNLLGVLRQGYFEVGGASDAMWDAQAAVHRSLPAWILLSVLALGTLILSGLFVRRTAPQQRPIRVAPDHPLRATIRQVNLFRSRFSPDLKLAPADLIGVLFVSALAVTGFAYISHREWYYRSLAAERYRAATAAQPAPTSVDLVPLRMSVRGRVDGRGQVVAHVEIQFRNVGTVAHDALTFDLNHGLTVSTTTASVGQIRSTRVWNRLDVVLMPAIAPADERTLRFDLIGQPSDIEFNLPTARTFVGRYGGFANAKVASQLTDLSRSYSVPRISRRVVELDATDLGPVPRYVSSSEDRPTVEGETPTAASYLPSVRFDVTLDSHGIALLADACGGFARADSVGNLHLNSSCELALSAYRVYGGDFVALPDVTGVAHLATLPGHVSLTRLHAQVFTEASTLAERAWPGLRSLANAVILEWPPPFEVEYGGAMLWNRWRRQTLADASTAHLLLIPESTLRATTPIAAGEVAAAATAHALLERRPVIAQEQLFFHELYRIVALMRLEQVPQQTAVIEPPPRATKFFELSVVSGLTSWSTRRLDNPAMVRLQALLHDLQHRVGPAAFQQALANFLAGSGPGSSKELFTHLERTGDVSLTTLYTQLFRGKGLPVLRFVDVTFHTDANGWEVRGGVQNDGNAETWCPVRLRTASGPVATDVTVAANSTAQFSLHSSGRPEVVLLDPDHRCFRFARSSRSVAGIDRVEYRGER